MEVEKLFQTSSIAAVREVETKTRHEIEQKKQQLRQVVGDSYRDLISSADTIIDISRSCHRLVDLSGGLQAGLSELAGSVAARQAAEGGAAAAAPATSSYDRLYALGSRIKYLIDTPETIYGCLDSGDHLAAARRYVRASEVHRVLTAGQAKHVAQRFPLLEHQWPLVKKFKPQVYSAAVAWLGSHGELSARQAAATLAAQALLKPMDGAEVLKAFLTARQGYIMQCLAGATGAGAETDLDSLACILADVATMVCATLAQCGELFLQLPGVSASPLLGRALGGEDAASDDLLFDAGREADAWKATLGAVRGRLVELSAAGLALECSQWLDGLSAALRALGGRLLGPCETGQGLLAVEAAVKAALEGWQYSLTPSSSSVDADMAADSPLTPAPPSPAEPTPAVLTWPDVCQWVLGRPTPLWPLLFEQPLLDRAKQLVGRDFSAVVDEVTGLLGAALQEAAALPPAAPGAFQASSWSEVVELQPRTPQAAASGPAVGSKRRRLAGQQPKPSSVARPASGSSAAAQGWLPQAEHVVLRFDEQLGKALEAALDACGGMGQPHAASAAGEQRPAGLAESAAGRALVLEPFVQDRCAEAADGIAAALDARMLALPRHQSGSDEGAAAAYAPTATQALILGRIALGLASRSSMLPLVLGSPDQWRAAVRSSSSTDASSRRAALGVRLPGTAGAAGAAAAPSPRYERLQQRLHSVGLQAYGTWAGWASEGLSAALIAGLAADQTLSAAVPLRAWEETVVSGIPPGSPEKAGDEAPAGGVGEMRFQLPATPSPASVQLALAACQEADRAGGHLLEDEALLLLKWQLGGTVLAALHAELATGEARSNGSTTGQAATAADADTAGVAGSSAAEAQQAQQRLGDRLSEKGVLQLLFDVRFLLDLLAGGRPPSSVADAAAVAAASAAQAARRREGAQLEAALSGRLDPIDWATYEPYLYANKQRAGARSQVLFGLLLRGERAQAAAGAATTAGGMPADSNILRVAPAGPRFSYLPVTTPVALLRQSSQLHRTGSSGQAELGRLAVAASPTLGLAAGASTAAGNDVCAASYSFASLLSNSKARAGGEEGGAASAPAGSAGSAAAAVGSGVASKLVGSLQGLLSDQLGDMGSTLGAPGGLLSSLGASFRK